MKTFEEALATVADLQLGEEMERPSTVNPPEVMGRFDEISREAASNVTVDAMLRCIAFAVEQGRLTPIQGLFAAFMNGLIVGVEMEKQTRPGFKARTPKPEAKGSTEKSANKPAQPVIYCPSNGQPSA